MNARLIYNIIIFISSLWILQSCEVLDLDCKSNFYIKVDSENVYATNESGDIVNVSIDSTKITGIIFNDEHRLTIIYDATNKTITDIFQDRFIIGSNNEIHFCEDLQKGETCTVDNSDWSFSNYDCTSKTFNFYKHQGVESFIRTKIPSYIMTQIADIDKERNHDFTSSFLR